jgi:hypothetical protein
MLEYCKTILSKVSFHMELFEKELRKALAELAGQEAKELMNWCYATFDAKYFPVLNRYFAH